MLSPRSAMMQRSPNVLQHQHQPPPSPSRPPPPGSSAAASAPRSVAVRPTLPDRNVNSDADIEDAYVRFVLYCNPAVPLESDTAALRESFRTPPRSGGKSFSTFLLFQLIRQLESKEIKTWADLALKLGVEPPDQGKGQSSQKIQQYAVRLKRWMHSMHVDAFFEYLMDRPHPYWTQIPSDPNPICDAGRDGVAAEDDMALRALLPHIRPRRGRKRPEDDDSKSPSQRPRLDSPNTQDEFNRHDTLGPWSAHPDGRSTFAPPSDALRSGSGSAWQAIDMAQTPLTAYPHSAITPSTRAGFWADEPRSAISPPKARSAHRRHGAKVVSSAWRSGPGSTGKTRGRPPINRTPIDGHFPSFPAPSAEPPSFNSPHTPTSGTTQRPVPAPPTTEPALPQEQFQTPVPVPQPPTSRPAKPSISLQVPTRPTGSVRLATPPPPVVMVNGQAHPSAPGPAPSLVAPELPFDANANVNPPDVNIATVSFNPGPDVVPQHPQHIHTTAPSDIPPNPDDTPTNLFDNMSDRTNIDSLFAHFVLETMMAEWVDPQGNPAEPCCVEEAHAIIATVMESMYKGASSKEAFLINAAALAGGKMLMTTSRMRLTRLERLEGWTKYSSTWEYRLGSIRGAFSMTQTVSHDKWKPPWAGGTKTGEGQAAEGEGSQGREGGSRYWQKKYEDLMGLMSRRDRQLEELRANVLSSLRDKDNTPSGT